MPNQYMDCPGCGKSDIPRVLVACFTCWPKLPKAIRLRIRNTVPHGAARLRAVGEARQWLIERRGRM